MAGPHSSGTEPARPYIARRAPAEDPNYWPPNAVPAPPPDNRGPQFPESMLRTLVKSLQLHGETHAAKVLKQHCPILDLASARYIISRHIKPKAVELAREIAEQETSQWDWEHAWPDRLIKRRDAAQQAQREARAF